MAVTIAGSHFTADNAGGSYSVASCDVTGVARASGEGLLVGIYAQRSSSAPAISSVVWDPSGDNQTFTLVGSVTGWDTLTNKRGLFVYALAAPTSAKTGIVRITGSGANHEWIAGLVRRVTGHSTSAMIRDFGTGYIGANVDDVVSATTDSATDDLVIDFVSWRDDVIRVSAAGGQSNSSTHSVESGAIMLGSSSKAGATSVTTTWNNSTNAIYEAAVLAASVAPAASAPNAPTGVTAGSITAFAATASWTDASGDETGFKVQYAPSPYSSWTTLSGSPTAANATSLATGDVLTDGTSYKFRVASTNSNGDSAWVESGVFTTTALTKLRPSADTTVGSATSTGANLYGVLDETTADDADYITVPGTLTSVSVVQGHPSETTIKSWTPSPGGTFATSTLTMTSGEASAITNYADLYLKIVTSSTTTKIKFETATDPGADTDHALVIRLRAA